MLAKINDWGNSCGVRLPKKLLSEAGFSESREVELIAKDGVIEIRKVIPKKKLTLKNLFECYSGPKAKEADGFGKRMGREEW